MNTTIAENLIDLYEAKRLIRESIISKGVQVPPETLFRNYGSKIAEIGESDTGGGYTPPVAVPDTYTRPEDRPSIPILNNNEIYLLFGVSPTGSNDYALTLTLNTGSYDVDWGDGTTNTYNSGIKSEHIFNYNTLDILPNNDGIKYVYIKYSSVNNITGIDINVRHSNRPNGSSSNIYIPKVYEMYIKASEVTSFSFSSSIYTRYQLLEILKYINSNKISNFSYFLYYSYNLRILDIDTSNGTNFGGFLYNCRSFNQPLNIDTGNGTNFSYFLANCYSFNQPLNIDTGNGTSFNSFLYGCYSFNQPLNIDTGNGTSFSSFLVSCYSFNQPLDIDTGNGTNFSGVLASCYSFNQPLDIDTGNGTSFSGFLANCYSFNQPLNIDTGNGTDFSDFLSYCYSFNQPLEIDTGNGIYFSNFLYQCYNFNQPLEIDTGNGTNFSYFLYGCYSFNQPLDINTGNGTNFNYFLYQCNSFNQPLNIDMSNGISFTNFLYNCNSYSYSITVDLLKATNAIVTSFIGTACYALTGLHLLNMGSIHTALTISNSNLDVDALVLLFNDLYDRTSISTGTITITNCYGASRLTAEQRAIATNKNWTIVG